MNKNSNHRSIAKAIIISVLSIGLAACGGGGGSSSGGGGQPHPPSGYQIQLSYHNTSEQKDSQLLQASGDGDNDIPFGKTGQITATITGQPPKYETIINLGPTPKLNSGKAVSISIPAGKDSGFTPLTNSNTATDPTISDSITMTSMTVDGKPVKATSNTFTLKVDGKTTPTGKLQEPCTIPIVQGYAGIQFVNNSGRTVYLTARGNKVVPPVLPGQKPDLKNINQIISFTPDNDTIEQCKHGSTIATAQYKGSKPTGGDPGLVKVPAGKTVNLYMDNAISARMAISFDKPLTPAANGAALDPTTQNKNQIWTYIEYTYNKTPPNFTIDQSNVDAFAWPIQLVYSGDNNVNTQVYSPSNKSGYVGDGDPLKPVTRTQVIDAYNTAAQASKASSFWLSNITTSSTKDVLRILSPSHSTMSASSSFDDYIASVCAFYKTGSKNKFSYYSNDVPTGTLVQLQCDANTFTDGTTKATLTKHGLFSGGTSDGDDAIAMKYLSAAFVAGQLPPANVNAKFHDTDPNDQSAKGPNLLSLKDPKDDKQDYQPTANPEFRSLYPNAWDVQDLYASVLSNISGKCTTIKGIQRACGIYAYDYEDALGRSSTLTAVGTHDGFTGSSPKSISVILNPE